MLTLPSVSIYNNEEYWRVKRLLNLLAELPEYLHKNIYRVNDSKGCLDIFIKSISKSDIDLICNAWGVLGEDSTCVQFIMGELNEEKPGF